MCRKEFDGIERPRQTRGKLVGESAAGKVQRKVSGRSVVNVNLAGERCRVDIQNVRTGFYRDPGTCPPSRSDNPCFGYGQGYHYRATSGLRHRYGATSRKSIEGERARCPRVVRLAHEREGTSSRIRVAANIACNGGHAVVMPARQVADGERHVPGSAAQGCRDRCEGAGQAWPSSRWYWSYPRLLPARLTVCCCP